MGWSMVAGWGALGWLGSWLQLRVPLHMIFRSHIPPVKWEGRCWRSFCADFQVKGIAQAENFPSINSVEGVPTFRWLFVKCLQIGTHVIVVTYTVGTVNLLVLHMGTQGTGCHKTHLNSCGWEVAWWDHPSLVWGPESLTTKLRILKRQSSRQGVTWALVSFGINYVWMILAYQYRHRGK